MPVSFPRTGNGQNADIVDTPVFQNAGELPAGFTGGHDIVDDQHVIRDDPATNRESISQVVAARLGIRDGLLRRGTMPIHIPDQRQARLPVQKTTDLGCLVEAANAMAEPVQRHRQYRVDGFGQCGERGQQ